MKVKQFKRLHPQDGDIIVFSMKEFDTTGKRKELTTSLGRLFKDKHIGIIFVEDVNDSVKVYQHLAKWLDEQRSLINEEKRAIVAVQEVQQEDQGKIS